ncbi:amidohydrolase family protein [Rhodococcus sp. HM1]|uniref:N-acyl-D-amino-acid deacylase family protein n=1 Tax=unclassified Rhodococcus (in: high G+C Gram-positive bacteria) TaxID=192944 RepID=UPI0018CD95F6|nr:MULTISPECIES: amidohydrolase family protein [unclassified Rhodococcus (in: high G+C Gram-positive bacteria)]MBH0118905.1 amidohydrolase family protein [Rhodococcus sp. CX]MCK8673135.1 amidohydrolase family protein [Rhodococcus sp. HM1]
MSEPFDVIVRGGLWFDGTGAPGVVRDLGIRGGVVVTESVEPLPAGPDTEVVDARGRWVMPGFVDAHTHYDAEVLVAPGLSESVRHGVTTVLMGNCSLSTVFVPPVDAADLFSRVEALPRDHVLSALETAKNWTSPKEYIAAIDALPLGPNVAAFIGHSDVRAAVMGLGRSTDSVNKPTREELVAIDTAVGKALDAGFLGVSTMTNPWDKIDGDRYRSRTLPSTHASWSEFRRLHRILRRRGRVLQAVPNLNTKYDVAFFALASTGIGRRPMKASILAAADTKAERWVHRIFGPIAKAANKFGRGAFRWQHLPTTFEVHSDGIDLVVFEEFGSGRAALHLEEEMGRNDLLRDEAYRRWFRQDFEKKFSPRVWHRDFDDTDIVACPDESLVGRSIGDVARERKLHPVDVFLDLVVEYGREFRWHTVIANDRPEVLNRLINTPGVTVGFSDAGAHLRNMAFYNYGIRMLRRIHDFAERGKPVMPLETAVHKLTGELGDFYGIDAGHLRVGDRADLVVVDPAGLDEATERYHEEPMPEFGGLRRMVNRNDAAVTATVVAGRVVFRDGEFVPGYGTTVGTGRFLRAGVAERGPAPARGDVPERVEVG